MKTAKFLLRAAVILSALTFLLASSVFASHFRYGHLTWKPRPDISPTTVEFTLTNAFRRSGYGGSGGDGMPIPGDVITEFVGATSLFFGDATSTSTLQYRVTGTDVAADWLNAVALDPTSGLPGILHTYPSAGPWTAEINSCCRIGNLANASNAAYRVLTIVETGSGNSSPVSSLPPIVTLQEGGVRTFFVPGADANGDGLSWRLATLAECFIPDQPGPPNTANALSVDAGTGLATWNTTGLAVGGLWACQVVVAEQSAPLRGNGAIGPATQVGVDFIIEIVPAGANNTPAFDHPASPACNTVFVVNSGDAVTFTVQASDPDVGDVVTINSPGLPAGSDMTPALPESGNPVSSVFSWTPGPGDAGVHVVTFTATDQDGASVLCSYTIRVLPPPSGGPTIDTLLCEPDTICFSYHVEDPNGGTLQFGKVGAGSVPVPSVFDTTVCVAVDTAGTYKVVIEVIDSCGAKDADTVTIRVRLNRPPTVTSNDTTYFQCDPAPFQICRPVFFGDPDGNLDKVLCDGQPLIPVGPGEGQFCFMADTAGIYTFVCIAYDLCGDSTIDSQFVRVVRDEQPPAIACPANIVVDNDAGLCQATVNYPPPQTSDNCPGQVAVLCAPASGSAFPVGTSTVKCIATDASGNKDSCTFTITVNDAEPPRAFCPQNISASNDPGQCGAELSFNADVGDNCPGATIDSCVPPSGSVFPVGLTVVTCYFSDAAGNENKCSFNVTVRDTTLPAVVCPADITVPGVQNGQVCEAIVNYPAPQTSDNCSGPVTVVCLPASGSIFPVGTTTVTCTATDVAGNEARCSFAVTVIDCGCCKDLIPPPKICTVSDIGNDQGRQVRVTWCASSQEFPPGNPSVFEYLLYRRIDSLPIPPPVAPSEAGKVMPFPPGQWDFITSVPAVDESTYNVVVATLEDSGSFNATEFYSVFFIRATNHDRSIFFDSDLDSGYSKDNIPPVSPTILAAKPNQGNVDVTWKGVSDRDLWGYRVYRDTTGSFSTAALLGHTASTLYQDVSPLLGKPLFYRVTAVDSAGNEGPPSGPASTSLGMRGDLNFDGNITPADIVILMNCVFSGSGACQLNVADVNCDGELKPSDLVLLMMRAINGIDFPC